MGPLVPWSPQEEWGTQGTRWSRSFHQIAPWGWRGAECICRRAVTEPEGWSVRLHTDTQGPEVVVLMVRACILCS